MSIDPYRDEDNVPTKFYEKVAIGNWPRRPRCTPLEALNDFRRYIASVGAAIVQSTPLIEADKLGEDQCDSVYFSGSLQRNVYCALERNHKGLHRYRIVIIGEE